MSIYRVFKPASGGLKRLRKQSQKSPSSLQKLRGKTRPSRYLASEVKQREAEGRMIASNQQLQRTGRPLLVSRSMQALLAGPLLNSGVRRQACPFAQEETTQK
jgi:hypothetical protein